ncbi:MAG: Hsp20/alpha crystallin family protein [Candidatus Coatesbacteria bacterium]|nr:Hsp20/alpha crystallin family protein [Candidatus Coatesbacteria bacterium]
MRIDFDISSEVERIQDQLNRLIQRVTAQGWDVSLQDERFQPAVDVYETRSALVLIVELPGVKASSIQVYGLSGAMHLEGVKESDYPPSGDAMFHAFERRFGKFEVKVVIPCPVQFAEAKAVYSDGLVRIELPKIKDRRQRKCVVPVEIV